MPLPEPDIDLSLVVRTDFSDDATWQSVIELLKRPVDGFAIGLEFIDNPTYTGVTATDLRQHAEGTGIGFAFIADTETMTGSEHTLLCVDLCDEPGRSFRVAPTSVASVQNNLELANMDFAEFADRVQPDGVFRGFGNDE